MQTKSSYRLLLIDLSLDSRSLCGGNLLGMPEGRIRTAEFRENGDDYLLSHGHLLIDSRGLAVAEGREQ